MNWLDRITDPVARVFTNFFIHRVLFKTACAVVLPACALGGAAVMAMQPRGIDLPVTTSAIEWPMQWQGQPLRPLALTDVELRFARRFPGAMARMTDGEQVLVLRRVNQPTRMLHPAVDCYQGLGYRIADAQLEQDEQQRLWRCFEAVHADGTRLRVCERIEDASGQGWTDTSAWYWAAVLGQSHGPWQAVTTARAL